MPHFLEILLDLENGKRSKAQLILVVERVFVRLLVCVLVVLVVASGSSSA